MHEAQGEVYPPKGAGVANVSEALKAVGTGCFAFFKSLKSPSKGSVSAAPGIAARLSTLY